MTEIKTLQPKASPKVMDLLQSPAAKKQILTALPKHLTADRFARIAMTEVRKNPKLGECDPMSFLGAVIQCAQLGLEPGSGLGHAYLIPFWNSRAKVSEVQFIPGYRGLIDLARRSGQIESITARVVHANDQFRYQYGDDERIEHMPYEGADEDAGPITHVYAIARLKGGGIQREVMTRTQIERTRGRSKNNNPVWDTDFDEMARKTVVRRICKYLPLSPEMARAIEADDASAKGDTQENWNVLDAEYVPQPQMHDPDKIKEIHAEMSAESEAAMTMLLVEQAKNLLADLNKKGPGYVVKASGINPDEPIETWPKERLLVLIEKLKAAK